MSDPLIRGQAGGWLVAPEGEGFVWHAWGPRGTDSGPAATEAVAKATAQMALERLREPPTLRLVE